MTEEEKMQVELEGHIEEGMLEKIEEYKKIIEEKEDRYLRMYAEFDNYKKRTEKEKMQAHTYAKGEILEMILPVIDSMENAVNIKTEDNNLREGINLMFEQLKLFLSKNGVEEIRKGRRRI